jgi:hypothetical protein
LPFGAVNFSKKAVEPFVKDRVWVKVPPGGRHSMQGSSYFRRQATTCLRLSESCTDQGLADRFQAMAEDFMVKAADAETFNEGAVIPLPHVFKRGGPGGGGADHD